MIERKFNKEEIEEMNKLNDKYRGNTKKHEKSCSCGKCLRKRPSFKDKMVIK